MMATTCPWCGWDVADMVDAEELQQDYEDVEGDALVKRGECPHCAKPIRIHLWIDIVEKDEGDE